VTIVEIDRESISTVRLEEEEGEEDAGQRKSYSREDVDFETIERIADVRMDGHRSIEIDLFFELFDLSFLFRTRQ
jgi:hypothetical protein